MPGTDNRAAAGPVIASPSRRYQLSRIDRQRRISRALDELLGIDRTRRPVPWSDGGMDLDYPTRDARGAELAAARWVP